MGNILSLALWMDAMMNATWQCSLTIALISKVFHNNLQIPLKMIPQGTCPGYFVAYLGKHQEQNDVTDGHQIPTKSIFSE